MRESQPLLFDIEEFWHKEWQGMPEFVQEDQMPWKQLIVSFSSPGELRAFAELIGRRITENTKSIWFDDECDDNPSTKRWGDAA